MSALPTPRLPAPRPAHATADRIFGHDVRGLHRQHWTALGCPVVHQGGSTEIDPHAGPWLLLERGRLVLFDVPRAARRHARRDGIVRLIVREHGRQTFAEQIASDDADRLVALRRRYEPRVRRETVAWLTHDAEIARRWCDAESSGDARAEVRATIGPRRRLAELACHGLVADTREASDADDMLCALLRGVTPSAGDTTVLATLGPDIIAHRSARVSPRARIIGPAWIGAGQVVMDDDVIVGPCVLPDLLPVADATTTTELRRTRDAAPAAPPAAPRRIAPMLDRGANLLFGLIAIALTLPLYPVIMLLIWLEDGRPFFFTHGRQTRGGGTFGCLKFRTMCRNAESLKPNLTVVNAADGPQFHVPDDPRLLRVGRWLRRFHLDELPQFFNVVKGEMNVVGPRPSPDGENQYCPAWREVRLSVRPGITGLWQVCRTRRPQIDFQEWIRFDVEYVRRRSWRLDLWIVWQTLRKLARI